jgi:hypothetical protein
MKDRELARLLDQAGLHVHAGYPQPDAIKKFAESIIKECIKICDDTENGYLSDESEQLLGEDNHKFAIGAGVCRNRINLKFGMK